MLGVAEGEQDVGLFLKVSFDLDVFCVGLI